MKGAKEIIATSPKGVVNRIYGTALWVHMEAGDGHWTIHESEGCVEGEVGAIIAIIPKTWTLMMVRNNQ
jgi:hypothetical protein